ncbi:hypothetical protein J6W91_00205 [Candidatus Saccharibacteria bacterium]|nr:hypothetical protein [Candidatus Saccharibacteria bacterium]
MENNKKKTNINLILGILIVLFSAVLGGEIYLLLTRTKEEVKPTPTSTPAPVDDDDDDEEEDEDDDAASDAVIQSNNTYLANGLARVATALNQYQANNRGKIPIGLGDDKTTTWTYFLNNYVLLPDEDVLSSYKFVFCDSFGTGGCKDSTKLTWDNNKYTIFVSAQAVCEDGVVKKSTTGTKNVAIYAVGQKTSKQAIDPVYCEDNVSGTHN